jgi:hypothetical protein
MQIKTLNFESMKKGLFIMMLAILGIVNTSLGQERVDVFADSVYVAGVEKTIETTYTYTYDGVKYYSGVAGFLFDVVNYVDTLTILIFEGGYDGVNYTPIDTLTELNGSYTYKFYQAPPVYQKYRMRAPLVSGDTATLENIIYFEKLPKLK